MHFGTFREYSVKIGTDKICVGLPENVGFISLAVVIMLAVGIMTTANIMHPTLSERLTHLSVISDL